MPASSIPLTTGDELPSVGLGLWKIDPSETAQLVRTAVETGYRHFDAAADYGNEIDTGDGLREAIADGLCSREDLWVTSKLWNTYHAAEHARPACERSLRDLGLEDLDLYLIHFPISLRYVPFETRYPPGWFFDPAAPSPGMEFANVPIHETWAAMENLVRAGLVRNIGVSNFNVALLRDLMTYASIRPSVLQVELHPYLTQDTLLRFCAQQDIAVTAFSPLGAPSYVPLGMASEAESAMEEEPVQAAAKRTGRSPAQILLRWAIQRGTAVVPKTSKPARLRENLDLYDFELEPTEMAAITALNRNRRFNDPGQFCEAAFNTFCPLYD